MIPPILLVAGLKVVQSLFNNRDGAPSPASGAAPRRGLRPFTYKVVAVPDHRVGEYVRRHDDVVSAKALYELFLKHGHDESAAALSRLAVPMQREHPDCTVLCVEFELK